MALRCAGNAIRPRDSGVEPLRRVRRGHLAQDHVGDLIVECLCIFFGIKIAMLFAPSAPASRQTVCDLFDRALWSCDNISILIAKERAERIVLGHACAAEIFLRENIRRDLRPVLRHLDVLHIENGLAIGITEHARARRVLKLIVGSCPWLCESACNLHSYVPLKKSPLTFISPDSSRYIPVVGFMRFLKFKLPNASGATE